MQNDRNEVTNEDEKKLKRYASAHQKLAGSYR